MQIYEHLYRFHLRWCWDHSQLKNKQINLILTKKCTNISQYIKKRKKKSLLGKVKLIYNNNTCCLSAYFLVGVRCSYKDLNPNKKVGIIIKRDFARGKSIKSALFVLTYYTYNITFLTPIIYKNSFLCKQEARIF